MCLASRQGVTYVVILATAAHLADGAGGQKPRRVILVTSDADFLDFRDYICEVLSVDAERPDMPPRCSPAPPARGSGRGWEIGKRAGGEGRVEAPASTADFAARLRPAASYCLGHDP